MSEHGTVARYVRGCRCEPCRTARREYDRTRWAKRKASHAPPRHYSPRNRGIGPVTLDVADLRYSYGLPHGAIAAELGIGVPAVAYHLAKHDQLTRLPEARQGQHAA